jgi:hypothetical protein
MKYLAILFLTFALSCAAQILLVLTIRAPVPAEYWLSPLISTKEALLAAENSPRLVFLGGSSTLFGIDAAEIGDRLRTNAMNMGLNGNLRLERLFTIARETVRPDDLLIMPLEPHYYSCTSRDWTGWQVRNGVAWDRGGYFDRIPLFQRIWAVLTGGDPMLPVDVLVSRFESAFYRNPVAPRLAILDPPVPPITAFRAQGEVLPGEFSYSAFNIDDQGDIRNTGGGSTFWGPPSNAAEPAAICPAVLEQLDAFNHEMKARGVRLLLAHVPYIDEGIDRALMRAAEAAFAASLSSIHIDLIDSRERALFPRAQFFDMAAHLNAEGRKIHTGRMIEDIAGLLQRPAPGGEITSR